MANKKDNILSSALKLFANEGYNSVPTSRIAHDAGVSEALIFRHFSNKKGLLDAIIADAEHRINEIFAQILFESDPKSVIRMTLELPFSVDKSEYDFWRLQFKLKWENEYNNPDKMKPLREKLTEAFHNLGYSHPELESRHLEQTMDAIAVSILRDGIEQQNDYKLFLLKKYHISE